MGALINIPQNQLAVNTDDSIFKELAGSAAYLPRIQLFGSSSGLVKQGKFPMAHWGLVKGKDDVTDLGNDVDVIPIAWRPKAMDVGGDEPLSYHKPDSKEFQSIREKSDIPNSNCMFGIEFLVWLPESDCFVTYFAANFGGKQEAANIRNNIGNGLTFKVKYVDRKKNPFHAPVVTMCATPISNLPDETVLADTLNNFNNPKDSEVKVASQAETDATSRAR